MWSTPMFPFIKSAVGASKDQWRTLDVSPRHKSPVAAVERIVAIVAHGENATGRHHQLAVHHIAGEHGDRRLQHAQLRRRGGKVVAVLVDVRGNVLHIRLVHGVPIEDELFVHQPDMIAWNPDRPLHQVFVDVHRIAEDDDVAAAHIPVRQQAA